MYEALCFWFCTKLPESELQLWSSPTCFAAADLQYYDQCGDCSARTGRIIAVAVGIFKSAGTAACLFHLVHGCSQTLSLACSAELVQSQNHS